MPVLFPQLQPASAGRFPCCLGDDQTELRPGKWRELRRAVRYPGNGYDGRIVFSGSPDGNDGGRLAKGQRRGKRAQQDSSYTVAVGLNGERVTILEVKLHASVRGDRA